MKQLDADNGWRGGATRRARSYKKLSLRCFKFEKHGVSYFLRFSFLSRKQYLSFLSHEYLSRMTVLDAGSMSN